MAMRLMGEQFVTDKTIVQAKHWRMPVNWKRKGSAILTICWAQQH